jgi:predicted P-loop ATPase/GTPase
LINISVEYMLLELQVVLQNLHRYHIEHTFGSPDSCAQVAEVRDVDAHKYDENHNEEDEKLVEFEFTLLLQAHLQVIDEDVSKSLQGIVNVLHDIGSIEEVFVIESSDNVLFGLFGLLEFDDHVLALCDHGCDG